MDFLASLPGTLSSWIIPFLFVLTVIVFVHEMGHYLVGRWCGAKAEAFSIGFGRELFGWNDKHGTRWKVSLVPLGGYVKFVDDENVASLPTGKEDAPKRNDGLQSRPLWARSAIVAAGPFANFLFAILVFAVLFMTMGRPLVQPVISEITEGSAAQQAELLPGDRIVRIGNVDIESFTDIPRHVGMNADRPLNFVIERDGVRFEQIITPQAQTITTRFGTTETVGVIGIRPDVSEENIAMKSYGPVEAVVAGAGETWFIIDQTMSYLWRLVTGAASADQLGGPIKIAQVTNQAAQSDTIVPLIQVMAILSVSIGLINLFPIPLLDGGHLVFYALEAIRGRPLSPKSQERAATIGFAMIMSLMAFAFWNDLT